MPRFAAVMFVSLFIALFSLLAIGLVSWGGSDLAHGSVVQHSDGIIKSINAGRGFVLQTASGQQVLFVCGGRCREQLSHMQRHLTEQAHTDVYYMREANNVLLAIDVD